MKEKTINEGLVKKLYYGQIGIVILFCLSAVIIGVEHVLTLILLVTMIVYGIVFQGYFFKKHQVLVGYYFFRDVVFIIPISKKLLIRFIVLMIILAVLYLVTQ